MREPFQYGVDSGSEPESADCPGWTPPRFLRRHAELTARRRKLRRLILWGLSSLFAYGFLFADDGLLSLVTRRIRIHRLEAQVAALEQRRRLLLREVELRHDDPATIERLAREEYGMIFEGEMVYRILEVSEEDVRRIEAARLRHLERQNAPFDATER
ncbi:MAG: septum formation initiator family protein [Candidatus Krumholzibacteriia bacterium]